MIDIMLCFIIIIIIIIIIITWLLLNRYFNTPISVMFCQRF